MKDQFVSTEHLLLALTQVDDQAEAAAGAATASKKRTC